MAIEEPTLTVYGFVRDVVKMASKNFAETNESQIFMQYWEQLCPSTAYDSQFLIQGAFWTNSPKLLLPNKRLCRL